MSKLEIYEIPGFTGYGASRDGRIWSRKRIGGQGSLLTDWRELKQSDVKGYGHVGAHDDNGKLESKVHRLIAITFIGPIPEGLEINHKNGNKRDNSVENLEIISHRENLLHALTTGIRVLPHGEAHCHCKVTDAQVRDIRRLAATNTVSQRGLAQMFGISQSQIGRIVRGTERREANVSTAI